MSLALILFVSLTQHVTTIPYHTVPAVRRLDPSERRAYERARDEAPVLVDEESPAVDFLRTEDDDPRRAAVRLTRYWTIRREVFGEDRWLLPMNQVRDTTTTHTRTHKTCSRMLYI